MVIGQRCHTTFATSLCAVILPQLNWYLIQLFLLWTYSLPFLQENGHDEISIKAMGRAINKTVMVAELIKVGSSSLSCLTMQLLEFLLVSHFFIWHLTIHPEKGWRSSSEHCYWICWYHRHMGTFGRRPSPVRIFLYSFNQKEIETLTHFFTQTRDNSPCVDDHCDTVKEASGYIISRVSQKPVLWLQTQKNSGLITFPSLIRKWMFIILKPSVSLPAHYWLCLILYLDTNHLSQLKRWNLLLTMIMKVIFSVDILYLML